MCNRLISVIASKALLAEGRKVRCWWYVKETGERSRDCLHNKLYHHHHLSLRYGTVWELGQIDILSITATATTALNDSIKPATRPSALFVPPIRVVSRTGQQSSIKNHPQAISTVQDMIHDIITPQCISQPSHVLKRRAATTAKPVSKQQSCGPCIFTDACHKHPPYKLRGGTTYACTWN